MARHWIKPDQQETTNLLVAAQTGELVDTSATEGGVLSLDKYQEKAASESFPGLLPAVSLYRDAILSVSGLIAYWPLNEAAGATAATDLGPSGLTATPAAPAQTTFGASSLITDGTPSVALAGTDNTGGLLLPSNASAYALGFGGNAPFSIECWFKTTGNEGVTRYLMTALNSQTPGASGGWRWAVSATDHVAFSRFDGAFTAKSLNGATLCQT